MDNEQKYVVSSLELHLFSARIMKEHSIFLQAGFTPANSDFAKTAERFKKQFESILYAAVMLANGVIGPCVLASGEIVTDHTLCSEQKTQNFTSIPINMEITKMETRLQSGTNPQISCELMQKVNQLNAVARQAVSKLIEFKMCVLDEVLCGRMFTVNYPLLIEHILREAQMYKSNIIDLENRQPLNENIVETEVFWDRIMMEHALFIRGGLDPSENKLICTANDFAMKYADLLKQPRPASQMCSCRATEDTLETTIAFRDFKDAGTEGILDCNIRSIILPLLGDHVLRESKHYIRLLKEKSAE